VRQPRPSMGAHDDEVSAPILGVLNDLQKRISGGQSAGYGELVADAAELEIPESVQTLLAARIDRLPEREKQVLQTAAVFGKEFAEPLLAAVSELPGEVLEEALRALLQAELIYEEALFPEREYAFKHPLTQAVAYGSLLRERRSRIHAAVARALAEHSPGKLDERAALLAHHWEEAGEALEAARWHRRAAEWAGYGQMTEAVAHWRKVRALVASIPEEAEGRALTPSEVSN